MKPLTEREIFFEALEMPTPEGRAAYLQAACGRDVTLRRKVEELLKEHYSNDSLLAGSALEGERDSEASPPASEAPAQVIGRYKLLEKIGEGGFGEVWMAEQREPVKRRVALKIIKLGMDSRQIVARFEAERQALAMMDHPNIAKIFDAGTTEGRARHSVRAEVEELESGAQGTDAPYLSAGRPYFVMELVRGIKITEYCDQNQLPTRERLKLFMLVCQAIQHAHQKGVIHRDIKPSNILVTLHDGVPVPKVIDFGIAKATQQELTDKTVFTQFQQFIGTPAYISPEQAEMSGLDIDTRSDIYSLGVLLYELLVGQTPFDAREMMQGGLDALRQIIREKEPLRPSTKLNTLQGDARTTAAKRRQTDMGKLVHQLQGDLDWIVMKCLEKDRTRRYETANGLANDIQRHLNNDAVLARPPSAAYRFQKAFRRNKLVFTAGAVVAVALVAGIGVSTWQAVVATKARGVAVLAQAKAEEAERATQWQLRAALLEQARSTVRGGELGQRIQALEALRRAAAISNSAELGREALAALALPDFRFEREMAIPQDDPEPQLDPSFARAAISHGRGPVEIRAVPNSRLLATLPASTNLPVFARRWSPDGRFLAVKRDYPDGGITADWEVWEVSAERCVLRLRGMVRDTFCFHPRVPRCIASHRTEGTAIWNLIDGREVRQFPKIVRPHVLRFSPDGERVAAVFPRPPGMAVAIHDVRDPNSPERTVSPVISETLLTLDWHPDGHWLAVVDRGNSVHWMNAATGEIGFMGQHKSSAVRALFSPDGDWLFTGGWEREIICWNARSRRRAFAISLDSTLIQISADGRLCAVTTKTNLQFYAFERPTVHREFAEDLGGLLRQATFSRDGRWLAASAGERVGLWELATGGPGALSEHGSNTRLFFVPEADELFATRLPEGTPAGFRWGIIPATNATAPPQLTRLPLLRPNGFTSLVLYSNRVVMTTTNGTRILERDELERETGAPKWAPTITGISSVSPDARWLGIYRSFGTALHIYQLPDLKPAAKLTLPASFGTVQFSPLGNELAIGSMRPVTRLEFRSTTSWERTRTLTNFGRLLYTPDGRGLWLSQDQRTAGLYDAQTFKPLLLLPTGTLPLAVSPDGRHLAVSVDTQRLQLWNIGAVREEFVRLGLDWEVR